MLCLPEPYDVPTRGSGRGRRIRRQREENDDEESQRRPRSPNASPDPATPIHGSYSPRIRGAVAITTCLLGALCFLAVGGSDARPLATGGLATAISDPPGSTSAELEITYGRARRTGAKAVRLSLIWSEIAPSGQNRPPGFNPKDHLDPRYYWSSLDLRIRLAKRFALEPIVAIVSPPQWAQVPGTNWPDLIELGSFAEALARRYSGATENVPRIRYWQPWNEPNLSHFLNPQVRGRRAVSPIRYRQMLDVFSKAVRSVHRDNLVISAGLAPFTTQNGLGPLHFMRVMLCMGKNLKPTCRARTRFDVWAHHAYTSGGPSHHAVRPDDVSLGDLPQMKRLLDAAVRAGHVVSSRRVGFWVTEFGWDTKPPDPKGVPIREHARWVAEALYRMWQSGVSLATWFQLRDYQMSEGFFQQGLYHNGRSLQRDRPKPAFQAFRFPTIALPNRGRVVVWGRTPTSSRGRVVLEFRRRGAWRRLAVVQANRHGIFKRTFRMRPGGRIRARTTSGELSLPFGVRKTRDRRVCPFGSFPNCPGPGSQ